MLISISIFYITYIFFLFLNSTRGSLHDSQFTSIYVVVIFGVSPQSNLCLKWAILVSRPLTLVQLYSNELSLMNRR